VKRVAILGGGPAGSVAAARIASAGLDVVVLDEKLAWEKPCGGGITYKAYTRYPYLIENSIPKRQVATTVLSDQRGGEVTLRLRHPLLIYSRYDLNGMLLRRAEEAGAQIEKERVIGLDRQNGGWAVNTRHGKLDADYVVVATGARNSLRNVGTEWTAKDTMVALGYYIPVEQKHIDVQFFPNFEGYIWVFPRANHLSAGICGKGEPSQKMRQRLERFLAGRGIPLKDATFYGHAIPALERPSFFRNRVSGEGWMAVGDAAGLVDPVTGEGLYYAIRSGDLAAEAVLSDRHAPSERHSLYRSLVHSDMIEELAFGASLARRFFLQRFLFSSVPARMIELMRRSPTMRDIVQDLFAGTQSYTNLKRRLLDGLNGTLFEAFMGAMLGYRVVKEGR
jgi:geranylgeranyl reductase family protein